MPVPPPPQTWFDSLPVVNVSELVPGLLYIFAGLAVGQSTQITNPVISVDEGTNKLHFVNTESGSQLITSYNTESEHFERHRNSAGMIANVASQIGWLNGEQTVTPNVTVNEQTVIGKIYPV